MLRGSTVLVVALALSATAVAAPNTTRLFVVAIDRRGAAVSDLSPADFDVKEHGATCRITSVRHGTAPMRVVILVDNSASGSAVAIFDSVKRGLRQLAGGLPEDAEVGIVTLAGRYSLQLAPTVDRARIQAAVASLPADVHSNAVVAQSLIEADNRLFPDNADRWPVFVVVAAGGDDTTMVKQFVFNAFDSHLQAVAATVHAVVMTPPCGNCGPRGPVLNAMARNLASNTGGLYTEITDPRTLPESLTAVGARISADQKRMAAGYEVEYVSTASVGPGDRSVEIGTARDGVTLVPSFRRTP